MLAEITREEMLKRIIKTEITEKMQKTIDRQYMLFFHQAAERIVAYDLYRNVRDYKSYNTLEKARISARAMERLDGDDFDYDMFLDFWEEELLDYFAEIEETEEKETSKKILNEERNVYVVATINNLCHLQSMFELEYIASSDSFSFEDEFGVKRYVRDDEYVLFTSDFDFRAIVSKEFFKENYWVGDLLAARDKETSKLKFYGLTCIQK